MKVTVFLDQFLKPGTLSMVDKQHLSQNPTSLVYSSCIAYRCRSDDAMRPCCHRCRYYFLSRFILLLILRVSSMYSSMAASPAAAQYALRTQPGPGQPDRLRQSRGAGWRRSALALLPHNSGDHGWPCSEVDYRRSRGLDAVRLRSRPADRGMRFE